MLIDTNKIISMTEANQNFSNVAREAEKYGSVVIFKNNNPKYILLDIEACKLGLPTSAERIEKAAKRKVSRAKGL